MTAAANSKLLWLEFAMKLVMMICIYFGKLSECLLKLIESSADGPNNEKVYESALKLSKCEKE